MRFDLTVRCGETALQGLNRKKLIVKNRVAPEIEEAVVKMAIEQPVFGKVRVSNSVPSGDPA